MSYSNAAGWQLVQSVFVPVYVHTQAVLAELAVQLMLLPLDSEQSRPDGLVGHLRTATKYTTTMISAITAATTTPANTPTIEPDFAGLSGIIMLFMLFMLFI